MASPPPPDSESVGVPTTSTPASANVGVPVPSPITCTPASASVGVPTTSTPASASVGVPTTCTPASASVGVTTSTPASASVVARVGVPTTSTPASASVGVPTTSRRSGILQHGDHIVQCGTLLDHHGIFLEEGGRYWVIHHTGWQMDATVSAYCSLSSGTTRRPVTASAKWGSKSADGDSSGSTAEAVISPEESGSDDLSLDHEGGHCVRQEELEIRRGGTEAVLLNICEVPSVPDGANEEVAAAPRQLQHPQHLWRFHSRPTDPDAAVSRAKAELGGTYYHLVSQNCEHYANYWERGLGKSNQIHNLGWMGISFGASAVAAGFAGVGATVPTLLGSKMLGSWATSLGLLPAATSFAISPCAGMGVVAAGKTFVFGRVELSLRRFLREWSAGRVEAVRREEGGDELEGEAITPLGEGVRVWKGGADEASGANKIDHAVALDFLFGEQRPR